jgi:hypothetical protein
MTLAKAQLVELKQDFSDEKSGGQKVDVQFNPETLKVTFANQIEQPKGGDQSSGTAGRQFVASSSTKLALALWFDVTAMEEDAVDDVRRLTQKVIYFMKPQPSDSDPKKNVPPGVSFRWGSFKFDGVVEGLEETLEFFSADGLPLRSNITLTLGQQAFLFTEYKTDGKVPNTPGQKPLHAARQNQSVQSAAAAAGKNGWQGIASANGIEDPMRLSPGQLIDLNASVGGSVSAGISVGGAVALDSSSSVGGASAGLNAALGGSASASIRIG